jgi:hypothetical protein
VPTKSQRKVRKWERGKREREKKSERGREPKSN